ncbi:CHRD domain-containing protein [Nocardioides astragali]|uniref:CHRD domain-containing protein n=1 Tax=Nocardioides astragali TaxID=1776736 RepID=A0ABW2MW50_9ACTN|nr:CHRD domain-containing protein [Nocardioides astragali]
MLKRVLAVLVVVVATLAGVSSAASAQTQVFTVHLAPSGDPDGSGIAVLRFDSDADVVCYTMVVRNINAPMEPASGIGSAHIHGPLPAQGIWIGLNADFRTVGADTHIARNCVSTSSARIDAVLANPELFYVNVHNFPHTGGAVQGSLG